MSDLREQAARAALRERQGAGARYDAPSAPAGSLALARRGTAYFARKLNELSDADLYGPSLLPGWTRAHVAAHAGYNARALARLAEGARTGVRLPMYASAAARRAEIELGSTLPARALRNLFDHAEVHLNVEWRDLADAEWDAAAEGIALRDTPWMRAREIWIHAVDLDNGGSFLDFPPDLLARLVPELAAAAGVDRLPEGAPADLARWLSGRGARRLAGALPQVPGPRDEG